MTIKVNKSDFDYTGKICLDDPTEEILVRYHTEIFPGLDKLKKINNGDFIDLRSAETVSMKTNEFRLISLGISIKLPDNYYAEVVPRSSTFKNFGIIMVNSIGIIDNSYCGDNDIWMFPALALRDTEIKINDRIAQFRIVKKTNIDLIEVDRLNDINRGGFGSTGIK